jgi:hypothetical protein
MSSLLKKLLPVALGVALPGLGTGIGAALGAGAAWAPTVGNAVLGAGAGALSGGGLKGALLGGLTGGVGGAAGSGFAGSSSLGSAATTEGLLAAPTGAVNGFSKATLAGSSGIGNALRSGIGKIASDPSKAGDVLSYVDASNTQDEIKKKLLAAQNQAKEAISPYTNAGANALANFEAGFDPSQLVNDPGYQFQLNQGIDAQNKALAARGMSGSGAALKAAQEYGQGLAGAKYNDAWEQWYRKNSGLAGAGQSATDSLMDLYGNIGQISAENELNNSYLYNKLLSDMLRR